MRTFAKLILMLGLMMKFASYAHAGLCACLACLVPVCADGCVAAHCGITGTIACVAVCGVIQI